MAKTRTQMRTVAYRPIYGNDIAQK